MKYWITKEGKRILAEDMSDSHLHSAIRYFSKPEFKGEKSKWRVEFCKAELYRRSRQYRNILLIENEAEDFLK
jgi:hypothetical protein